MTAPTTAPKAPETKPKAVPLANGGPITVKAPPGAHFDQKQLSTNRGADDLPRKTPQLVWDNTKDLIAVVGEEAVLDSINGTSLCVSYDNIARRMCLAGKTDNEIAAAQVAFRPGKRGEAVSTPQSRAKRAAASAAEKTDGDAVAAFLAKVAAGQIKLDASGNIVK